MERWNRVEGREELMRLGGLHPRTVPYAILWVEEEKGVGGRARGEGREGRRRQREGRVPGGRVGTERREGRVVEGE